MVVCCSNGVMFLGYGKNLLLYVIMKDLIYVGGVKYFYDFDDGWGFLWNVIKVSLWYVLVFCWL